jgi:hypothetical protein
MYHIGFAFTKSSFAKRERIDQAITNASADWVRYSSSAWIAYADNPETLHIHIREAIDNDDQFLVIPLDMSAARQGLLAPWIWEWLRVDRTQPNWRRVVDAIDYPKPLPPLPVAPKVTLHDLFAHLNALQPPKDELK